MLGVDEVVCFDAGWSSAIPGALVHHGTSSWQETTYSRTGVYVCVRERERERIFIERRPLFGRDPFLRDIWLIKHFHDLKVYKNFAINLLAFLHKRLQNLAEGVCPQPISFAETFSLLCPAVIFPSCAEGASDPWGDTEDQHRPVGCHSNQTCLSHVGAWRPESPGAGQRVGHARCISIKIFWEFRIFPCC